MNRFTKRQKIKTRREMKRKIRKNKEMKDFRMSRKSKIDVIYDVIIVSMHDAHDVYKGVKHDALIVKHNDALVAEQHVVQHDVVLNPVDIIEVIYY